MGNDSEELPPDTATHKIITTLDKERVDTSEGGETKEGTENEEDGQEQDDQVEWIDDGGEDDEARVELGLYEKPPLYCFYCGRLGHGTKDCSDYKEEEEPELKYGLWLKASPWKQTPSPVNKERGESNPGCAKVLFVTKPKKVEEGGTKNQMREMLDKLRGCVIHEEQTHTSKRKEGEGQETMSREQPNTLRSSHSKMDDKINDHTKVSQEHAAGQCSTSQGKTKKWEKNTPRNHSQEFDGRGQEEKHKTWNLIKHLCREGGIPILFGGDFNEILSYDEKEGGVNSMRKEIDHFRGVIDECELQDLGYSGQWYTWERGRSATTRVRERLDRYLATTPWCTMFTNCTVENMVCYKSDHSAILLRCMNETGGKKRKKKKAFKFETCWLLDESCERVVKEAWEYAGNGNIMDKLTHVGRGIGRLDEPVEGIQLVSDLINFEKMEWDVDRIEASFNQRDVNCILAIPLSVRAPHDDLSWAFSKDGKYSVRNAYMLGKGCNLENFHQAWVDIWKETLGHALFECWRIRSLWEDSDCGCLLPNNETANMCAFIVGWRKFDEKTKKLGAYLLWNIWMERNKKLFENKTTQNMVIVERVKRQVEEFGKYNASIYAKPKEGKGSIRAGNWQPPPNGVIKINADATVSDNGWARWVPAVAEAKAMVMAVKLGRRFGCEHVTFETDCQEIASRLSKGVSLSTELDLILGDIMSLCAGFRTLTWSHVSREGNFVAHHLARLLPLGTNRCGVIMLPKKWNLM
ncbi:hypothetical protein RDABS01_034743 [Bienertia sinuspersici]